MIIHLFLLLHCQFQAVDSVRWEEGQEWGQVLSVPPCTSLLLNGQRGTGKEAFAENTAEQNRCFSGILTRPFSKELNKGGQSAALKGLHKADTKFQLQSACTWRHPAQSPGRKEQVLLTFHFSAFGLLSFFPPPWNIQAHPPLLVIFHPLLLTHTQHRCGAIILKVCFQSVPPKREPLT